MTGGFDHADRGTCWDIRWRYILPCASVTCDLDQPVAGSRPYFSRLHVRDPQRCNRGGPVWARGWRARFCGGLPLLFPREIGTQLFPVHSTVTGSQNILRAQVKKMWIMRRKNQRRHVCRPILLRLNKYVSDLSRGLVRAQHAAEPSPGVDEIMVHGIGSDVGKLPASGRRPFAHGDLAKVAAAGHRRGAAILLRGEDVVGKSVVRAHVVELSRRLVVPGTPGRAAIHANDSSLIHPKNHMLRSQRIDP